jgi:hypothetical protein
MATIVLVLLLGAWPAVVVTHRMSRSLGGRAAGIAPLPARPAAPPRPDVAWAQARSRFDRLCAEYAAYECDPISVLAGGQDVRKRTVSPRPVQRLGQLSHRRR